MKDQSLLTPAAMAGQLNKGGPVRGPKDQPSNGPRPKPQLSLMESGQASSSPLRDSSARLSAHGKEVGSNEKGSSKSAPVDCGVVANRVNLWQACA
jgi:hypothetical protein